MSHPAHYDEASMARFVAEPIKESVRSPFARDRARVLHSAGLRRLAAKTQVMTSGVNDFPRTRLTHTLEVAQIARELGEALGCDPDVVEVAGLAHDLGHPPFGHNGEIELDRLAQGIGGFEGNAQTLRIVSRLEAKVVDARGRSAGLNLTRATLDASCKYPWARREGTAKFGYYADDAEVFHWLREGAPEGRQCIEEQVMNWADDVAYSIHDVEDAIHAGLVRLDDLRDPQNQRALVETARERFDPERDPHALDEALERLLALDYWPREFDGTMRTQAALKKATSYLISRFCVTTQVATQIAHGDAPLTRYAADLVVPDEVRDEVAVMKAIAVLFVMRRPGIEAEQARQRELVAEVVHALRLDEGRSLEPWLAETYAEAANDAERMRVIIDQVASLTDVSIVRWHERLIR
ncbi:MAG: deoxyguanosinetriphosphate triphosphohydrolase [Candidatus Nanopelagicales bacterium]|nr:deoxyguanosinetriphosphate triphosphohydrolase [Candidatus Nanopelagicales bacterium]